MSSGRLSVFNMSVRGSSHIECGMVCQDASASWSDGRYAAAVVCDGHGGSDYVRSDLGARFGCSAALENVRTFLKAVNADDMKREGLRLLKNLEASIIHSWNERIYDHLRSEPFTDEELTYVSEGARRKYVQGQLPEEAYGTTMIVAAMTEEYLFGFQIGDGRYVTVSEKKAESSVDSENRDGKDAVKKHYEYGCPIPWDDACFANVTTSMCDSDAIDEFREYLSFDIPKAVFLCTDGADDCFTGIEQLSSFYGSVLFSFENKEKRLAEEELMDYLPRLSAKGSGDDISIAAVIVREADTNTNKDTGETVSTDNSQRPDRKKNRRKKHKKKKKIKKGIKRSRGNRKKR